MAVFIISTILKALFIWSVALIFININIFLERKVSALMQDRIGPNRASICGFRLMGLVHNIADAVKLIMKEDITPASVDRLFFNLSPAIIMTVALLTVAVIPFADTLVVSGVAIPMQVMDLNVGFLYILALSSLSVYSLVLGGWSSNSKYPLLAGMRSSAQMISYEISLGLSLVGLVMIFGTVNLSAIVHGQGECILGFVPKWGVVVQPLGALLFIVAVFAELNRNPFDLPEGESEILGFHIEYSSMKFALFFMGEYGSIFAASAMITTLFFGGWQIPWLSTADLHEHADVLLKAVLLGTGLCAGAASCALYRFNRRSRRWGDGRDREPLIFSILLGALSAVALAGCVFAFSITLSLATRSLLAFALQVGVFLIKTFFFCFFVIWVRWTLPRFRYDQLMSLGWKVMLPLGIANVFLTGMFLLIV